VFTVILLSESARAIFEPVRVYFEPFVESGAIAFCDWDPSPHARSMRQAVPDLPEIIKGKSSWRAVVVDHPRGEASTALSELRDLENPFDFRDNTLQSLNLEDSQHALIRLSHILLGYPQMSAKHFTPYLQYEHAETGDLVEGDARQLLIDFLTPKGLAVELAGPNSIERSNDEWFSLATMTIGQTHNKVRRLFREVAYEPDEQARHRELTERYRMKEVRPSEVIFIATRARFEDDEKLALQRAWNSDVEQNSSRFVERNDYPPMSRFATYELLEPENSGYDQDLLRFWLSLLTISQNQLPPGGFQSDRLYRMSVEFGTSGLAEMLNAHISQLAMVRDHLDRLLSAPQKMPELVVEDLLTPVETLVSFDDLGGSDLQVSSGGYGLASDSPRDEHRRFGDEVAGASSAAAVFMRKPRRAVARSVHSARELARVDTSQSLTLDDFEREELEDELAKRLRSLVVPATPELIDTQRMQRAIDRGDRRVSSFISQRMKRKTIIAASSVSLGIWFVTFIPYFIQSWQRGAEAMLDGVLLVSIVLLIIGAGIYVTLLAQRFRLRLRIAGFNAEVQAEVSAVHAGAERFAQYLSEFVTYRRGAERLRSASRAQDFQAARLRRIRALRETVVGKIAGEKDIVLGLGAQLVVHRTSSGLVNFDADDEASAQTLFRFPTGENSIPFNESGENINAPYDFITQLTLRRITLFESNSAAVDEVNA
jgi:hypothetical protein